MTIEERLAILEERVDYLRRRNRLLIRIALPLAIVLALFTILETTGLRASTQSASSLKIIAGRAFSLEDDSGRVRATLMMGEDGPKLLLADENETIRALFAITEAGSALAMFDERGAETVALTTTSIGSSLSFFDTKGNVRLAAGIENETPFLSLRDINEQDRFMLSSTKEGTRLQLQDGKGLPRIGLGVSEDDSSGLAVNDQNGVARIILVGAKRGPSLVLFDERGQVIWTTIKK